MPKVSYSQSFQDESAVETYREVVFGDNSTDGAIWTLEQKIMDRILARAFSDPRKVDALDFACGTGRITRYLETHVGSVTGLDISPSMLKAAREDSPNVEFIAADITADDSVAAGPHQLITSFRFLLKAEPDLRRACIQALSNRLNPETGIMVLSIHSNSRSIRGLKHIRDRLFRRNRRPYAIFSMKQMRTLARETGLEISSVHGLGYLPPRLARLISVRGYRWIERILMDLPILRHFGTHLLVVCSSAAAAGED